MEQTTIKGRLRIKSFVDGKMVYCSGWQNNLVTEADTHGLNRIIRLLAGQNTPIGITKGKIGTGNTAPTVADTNLETPIEDVEIANITITDTTTVLIEFFISSAFLPDNTYREFGTFIGDKMFSRALLDTPYEKAGLADTAIDYEFNISNVTGS